MNNISDLSQTASRLPNSSAISQLMTKLNGNNITTIFVTVIAAVIVGYVCSNGGSLEITAGDKTVVLNSSQHAV